MGHRRLVVWLSALLWFVSSACAVFSVQDRKASAPLLGSAEAYYNRGLAYGNKGQHDETSPIGRIMWSHPCGNICASSLTIQNAAVAH